MLLYDWTWWGHITNQKEGCAEGCVEGCAEGCTEGCAEGCAEGAQRGAWRVRGGVCRGVRRGCAEGCMEGVRRGARRVRGGVCRGVHGGGTWRGAFVLDCHWLPLATIDLVGDNREFEDFRHILSCYTHYSWLIVLDLQRFITVCPWLLSVAHSNR